MRDASAEDAKKCITGNLKLFSAAFFLTFLNYCIGGLHPISVKRMRAQTAGSVRRTTHTIIRDKPAEIYQQPAKREYSRPDSRFDKEFTP